MDDTDPKTRSGQRDELRSSLILKCQQSLISSESYKWSDFIFSFDVVVNLFENFTITS